MRRLTAALMAGAVLTALAAPTLTSQALAAPASSLIPPPANLALAKDLLKQLIETDTQHDKGSTGAAKALADRFIAAGFAPADVQVLIPADHPIKGNVVVRLHGKGKAKPILYICHLDVVNARRADWTYDPFKLTEKDGWYYGRGTIDMKGQDAAVAASLIRLKQDGFKPEGDLIVAFTADEEAGGDANGVEWLVKEHRPLVDAGLVINPDGGEAGVKLGRKLYLGVQTSEKVYVTYGLEVTDKGGHSSRPTPANPIFRLSKALARLADYRFPVHLTDTTRLYFKGRAALEQGQLAADMASMASEHPDPAAVERLSGETETNIVFRTTCTVTEITGGHAESALPQRVRATIQCRVIPGETMADVQAKLTAALADPSIKLSVVTPGAPSPESPPSPRVLKAVEKIAHGMWPEVALLPLMSAGASDSAYTRIGGMPSYGIDAMFDDLDDGRAHGQDERIGVQAFAEEVEFTYRLMKLLASGG
jgi:acetylornithine deacetylase/succinyl-diaminopimelate desuccinylase-like protein